MRTISGLPTKKAIIDLCEKHGLMICKLLRTDEIAFGNRYKAITAAEHVVAELRSFGFTVELREPSPGINGIIYIREAVKSRRKGGHP